MHGAPSSLDPCPPRASHETSARVDAGTGHSCDNGLGLRESLHQRLISSMGEVRAAGVHRLCAHPGQRDDRGSPGAGDAAEVVEGMFLHPDELLDTGTWTSSCKCPSLSAFGGWPHASGQTRTPPTHRCLGTSKTSGSTSPPARQTNEPRTSLPTTETHAHATIRSLATCVYRRQTCTSRQSLSGSPLCQEPSSGALECAPVLVAVKVVRPVGRCTLTAPARRRGGWLAEAAWGVGDERRAGSLGAAGSGCG